MKPFPSATDLASMNEKAEKSYFAAAAGSFERHRAFRELEWVRYITRRVEAGERSEVDSLLQLAAYGREFIFCFVPFELLTLTGNKLEDMCAGAGFAREGIFIAGYSNALSGYLAPEEEIPHGGYEVTGAAHWCGVPECCAETERALLRWFSSKLEEFPGHTAH